MRRIRYMFLIFVIFAISILLNSCSTLSVRDIKEMDPFLRNRSTRYEDNIYRNSDSLYSYLQISDLPSL